MSRKLIVLVVCILSAGIVGAGGAQENANDADSEGAVDIADLEKNNSGFAEISSMSNPRAAALRDIAAKSGYRASAQ